MPKASDFAQLIRQIAPAVGALASGGDGGHKMAFWNSFQQQEQRRQQRQDAEEREQQRRALASSEYLMDAATKLHGIGDPGEFSQLAGLYDEAGAHANYFQPGYLREQITFNQAGADAKQVKALQDALDQLEKDGYDLDQLAEADAVLSLDGGKTVPVSAALNATRRRPLNPEGQAVPKPAKADPTGSTDYGRFLARYAKERGKTLDTLSAADELDAKKQYGLADNAPPAAPKPPDRSFIEAQFDDLMVTLSPTATPQDKQAAQLRIEQRKIAQRQIGQADDRPPVPRPTGPTDAQEFSMSERLARAWSDATKSTREVNRQLGLMETGLKRFRTGDKNGGSQAVLVTFQKILDPTSVVRESEYARTAAGQSFLNRIDGYVDRLRSGGAGMTDGELAQMVQTARDLKADLDGYSAGTRRRIDAQAKKYQLDPATIFDDALLGGGGGGDALATGVRKLESR